MINIGICSIYAVDATNPPRAREPMRERGVLITGEVELAYEAGKGDVLAITGTNGKTTTTALPDRSPFLVYAGC